MSALLAACGGGGKDPILGGADLAPISAAPTVSSVEPANAATGVSVNRNLTATFSEAMDPATLTAAGTFTLMQGTATVPGVVTYAGTTATFNPMSDLAAGSVYTATVTTGARNTAGIALASDKVWSFTTDAAAAADTTAPVVSSVDPANAATEVAFNRDIVAIFSEAMDASTLTAQTLTLKQGLNPVAGSVSYVGSTATFNPDNNLAASTVYTATVTTGARDLAGNALSVDRVWSFTTGAAADTTAPTVSSVDPSNAATRVPVNRNLTANFSEAMDASTLTTQTLTLKQGGNAVAGAVTYVGTTATFNPDSNLAASTVYTATVTTGVRDLAGNALATDRVWSFTTSAAADTTAPSVSSVDPANSSTGVAANRNLTATFNEAMDASTITTQTLTLKQGSNAVAGAVSYVGTTATFNPDNNLAASTVYTATVTTGARDLAGNALTADRVWSFTTGAAADTTAPTVTSVDPADAATGVAVNRNIAATFSEAMDASTVTTQTMTLKQGVNAVAGSVSYVGTTATFNPDNNLAASTVYTATVTTGARDLTSNALATEKVWRFTTSAAPDTTAPTVTSTLPANAAAGVEINANITATFSEAMDPLTVTDTSFSLKQGNTPVAGAVTHPSTTTATFNPDSDLTPNTTYTATVSTAVEDLAGNAMALTKTWSFTTRAAVVQGPLPVDLGTAGNFVVLSKSGISTTGATSIIGDIGVSPIGATAITGFPMTPDSSNQFSTSPLVTGRIYAANYATPTPSMLTTAISDMELAFTNAAGRPTPDFTELGAGNISGLTLVPGLYKWGTGVLISAAGVTLSGGANDVWIFQIGQDLTVNNSAMVTLIGGAQAKNIFWQVAGKTTLGTAANFQGNILSQTLISLNTGAVLNGRALAQTAVTLNANSVTKPAP